MEILNTEIKKYSKGTKYESKVLEVLVNDACDYNNQFTDAINLIYKENKDLKLDYFTASNVEKNTYKLCFNIK